LKIEGIIFYGNAIFASEIKDLKLIQFHHMAATAGKVSQIIGPVVDVTFSGTGIKPNPNANW
jgi:hypothetical protein